MKEPLHKRDYPNGNLEKHSGLQADGGNDIIQLIASRLELAHEQESDDFFHVLFDPRSMV